jgi:hypothetical protein
MANNNNNPRYKTRGSSNINKEIEIEKNLTTSSNMANSSSIIKINKTEYWLPEELWREVKDFMGLCKKEDNVQWEFIKKAKLQDVLKLKLPQYRIQYEARLRPTIEINAQGTVTLRKYDGSGNKSEPLTPQVVYFKSLKGIYMRKGKMTPKRWKQLSEIMTKKVGQWERCKEGDKFKYACDRTIRHGWGVNERRIQITNNKTVLTIATKLKTVCVCKFTDDNGRTWQNLKLKKSEFNNKGMLNCSIKQ